MALATARLDRFIAQRCNISRRDVRLMLVQQRVVVDGCIAKDISQRIDNFSHIYLDGQVLQANKAHYIMLHKPVGVVCATQDEQHKTVIDLLDDDFKDQLHIVGRLDLNTSGLVLLTNDSRWSERLTQPMNKVNKRYCVTLKHPLTDAYAPAFAKGMYFDFENITTKPVQLTVKSEFVAQVDLIEGRYHQIKRMFGRFRNPVVALHRESIGNLKLDDTLAVGTSRVLSSNEKDNIFSPSSNSIHG